MPHSSGGRGRRVGNAPPPCSCCLDLGLLYHGDPEKRCFKSVNSCVWQGFYNCKGRLSKLRAGLPPCSPAASRLHPWRVAGQIQVSLACAVSGQSCLPGMQQLS